MFINIMSNSRYFKVEPQIYEQVRLSLDLATSMPEGETVYEPLATAPKASDEQVLIAIRNEHCAVEPYSSTISGILSSGNGIELNETEYQTLLPQISSFLS